MKIYENRNKRRVGINGMKIGGCILKQICSVCRKNLVYYDKFDADFCPSCNEWKQEKCSDMNCHHCSTRPTKPLERR